MAVATRQEIANACTEEEWALRVDLAAVLRLAARFGWHESIANHFSVAVTSDGKRFLMNPRWMHFSLVKASDLLLLDAADNTVMAGENAPDRRLDVLRGLR